ncbi:hypothetical protein [Bacillus alveayuensis]|uniref:hypothetical protein n=1 Tax=Aeribacillus alveayuensis TaxID=279215 RepID=UPI0006981707|nr:hypothetical protein [Bacillus alveayuensis]
MNSISNKKINQVTDQTLVVGMDIAKKKQNACFVDERGITIATKAESEEADGTGPTLHWRNGRTTDGP